MSEDLTRVTIRISNDVYEWFKIRSKKTGVPASSLMFLALEHHIQQNNAINELPKMIEELKALEERTNGK